MRLLDFSHDAMMGAAAARMESLVWRVGLNSCFAISAWAMTESLLIPSAWLALVVAATGVEGYFARRYITTRGEPNLGRARLYFTLASIFSLLIFSILGVYVMLATPGLGRLIATVMAACALVNVTINLYQARGLLVVCAAPPVVAILLVPLMATPNGVHLSPLNTALGFLFCLLGFLACAVRSAMRMDALFGKLKQARRIAEAGSQAKTEFLAKMTHQLRTPLNAIIGYAEILHEDIESGSVIRSSDADRIRGAGRNLVEIVDQAILHSEHAAGGGQFDARAVAAVLAAENNRVMA